MLSEAWRGGGIMTGERECPAGESETGGDDPAAGPDCVRSGRESGVTNPTWRTLGSITIRAARRASMDCRGLRERER